MFIITDDDRIDYPEIFKVITYPRVKVDKYEISNYGRVREIKRQLIMKTHLDKDDHECITLVSTNKKPKHFFIHRLEAWEFLGPPPSEEMNIVHHKNGIPCFNYIHNLEWTSILENTLEAKRAGMLNNAGMQSSSCKYPEFLIRRICCELELGKSNIEVYESITGNRDYKSSENSKLYSLINKLHRRTSYREIVSEYDYLPDKTSFSNDPTIIEMRELIQRGYSNLQIMKHFGYPSISSNKTFYNRIISERAVSTVLFNDYRKLDNHTGRNTQIS